MRSSLNSCHTYYRFGFIGLILLAGLSSRTATADSPKPAFRSSVVTRKTLGHGVDIDVDITGAKELYLVVTDARDGFDGDVADWKSPVLVGPEGETSLTNLPWKYAFGGWGNPKVNKNVWGGPLQIDGNKFESGIGTHAYSIIGYELPKGFHRFKAFGGLDSAGLVNDKGATVEFQVFLENPSTESSTLKGFLPDLTLNLKTGNPHQHTVEQIVQAWQKRQAVTGVTLTWALDKTGQAQFARHHNNWATDKEDRPRVLKIHENLVRYGYDEFETTAFDLTQRRILEDQRKIDEDFPFAKTISSKQRFLEMAEAQYVHPELQYRDPFRLTSFISPPLRWTLWEPQEPDMARAVLTKLPGYGETSGIYGHLHRDGLDSLDALDMLAPLLVFRPLHPHVCGIHPENCTIDETMMSIQGHECVVIREQLKEGSPLPRRSYWCDPRRDFLILRYIGQGTKNEVAQLDITYHERPNLGWSPSEWKATCYQSNDFVNDRFIRSVVSEVSQTKPDLATDLTINFPPGTWLIDEIEGKESLVDADGNSIPIELADNTELLDQLRSLQDQATRLHSDWMALQKSRNVPSISLRTVLLALLVLAALASCFHCRKQLALRWSHHRSRPSS